MNRLLLRVLGRVILFAIMLSCSCCAFLQPDRIKRYRGHWTLGPDISYFTLLNDSRSYEIYGSDAPDEAYSFMYTQPLHPDPFINEDCEAIYLDVLGKIEKRKYGEEYLRIVRILHMEPADAGFFASRKHPEPPDPNEMHFPLPKDVSLLGGTLRLHLEIGDSTATPDEDFTYHGLGRRESTSSHYTLIDSRNQKVLGTAESSITKQKFEEGLFYGYRMITVAHKSGDVLIAEDVSDASPWRRYIYLQRKGDGHYRTFYLAPPFVHIVSPGAEFQDYPPSIHMEDENFSKFPRSTTPFTWGG